jgi:hypothetical protein
MFVGLIVFIVAAWRLAKAHERIADTLDRYLLGGKAGPPPAPPGMGAVPVCLSCGRKIPPGTSRCPRCGWSAEDSNKQASHAQTFGPPTVRVTAYIALLALPFLQGCVVLPIPHTRTVVPEITGRLVPPPPVGTVVQYHLDPSPGFARSGVATTDPEGILQIPEQRKWSFLFIVCLLPLDPVWSADLEVRAAQYGACNRHLFRFPAQVNRVHISPFDLGEIRLE